MKYTITNTAKSLFDLVGSKNKTQVYIQNISAVDVYFDNKITDILTEGVVLKAGNEQVFDIGNYDEVFVQSTSDAEVRILFSNK